MAAEALDRLFAACVAADSPLMVNCAMRRRMVTAKGGLNAAKMIVHRTTDGGERGVVDGLERQVERRCTQSGMR